MYQASPSVMGTEHAEYVEYLQDRFFRTGPYTHLYVDMNEAEDPEGAQGGTLKVKWIFTFQDLGSTHILSRDPAIVGIDPVSGSVLVDGAPYPDVEHAERAIFEGHYANYMLELYAFEGIETV